jgi:hypothetical protein
VGEEYVVAAEVGLLFVGDGDFGEVVFGVLGMVSR